MATTQTLRDAVNRARKSNASTQHTSGRNPQFYNNQRREFIKAMVNHDDVAVRLAAVENPNLSSGVLKNRLQVEEESQVIRAMLMHPALPKKVLEEYALDDPRAEQFSEDTELSEYVEARLAGIDDGSDDEEDEQ